MRPEPGAMCFAPGCRESGKMMRFSFLVFSPPSARLRGKRVQRQPMTNGGINVEIGNPSYNMYEVDHDNHADAGSLLRPNFTLDPHKVGAFVR